MNEKNPGKTFYSSSRIFYIRGEFCILACRLVLLEENGTILNGLVFSA